MSEEALHDGGPWRFLRILARRRVRSIAEAGYDTAAWGSGLLAMGLATRDLAPRNGLLSVWAAPAAIPLLTAGCGLLAGLYRRRYLRGSLEEVAGVAAAVGATALCLAILSPMLVPGQRAPLRTLVGGTAFALLAMLGARYVAYAARLRSRPAAPSAVRIIVFGAGEAGTQLIRRLTSQPGAKYQPVGILDDDPEKRRLRIHGVPVLGDRSHLSAAAERTGADVLVIALAGPNGPAIRELTAAAENCGLIPKVIPTVTELLTGGARIEGVRDPRLTDLLGRRPVRTDVAAVGRLVAGKRVLVTGAGGSIGSELCRQLHRFDPAELVILDRDESALHAVQLELHGRALLDSDDLVLADIRDPRRIREIFDRFRPQIVFHAAALKHLPLLERAPAEAVKTNVLGTLAVLEAAAACDVESFVNISTDKAADPVSVLGYSKRIAERLTAHVAGQTSGVYLSVRFGNVLGSRGSVLTALSAQVAAGGPVTVTHPDVTRYFMTADEAVQLVLQAAVIGGGGEVLVLDMGEPVRIADMARRVAASSGQDLDLVFTGLRPGEKLAEDLLGSGEPDHRPRHPLISQAPVPPLAPGATDGLNPAADPEELKKALARCASQPDPGQSDGADSRPADVQWPGAWPVRQPTHTQATRRLGPGIGTSPAQFGQPSQKVIQQGGGGGIPGHWAVHWIHHVVRCRLTEKCGPVPSGVQTGHPGRKRLACLPRSCLPGTANELLQGERPWPGGRQGHDRVPDVLPRHAEHQVRVSQVGGGDDATAVRAEIKPVPGHNVDHRSGRRRAVDERPCRSHGNRHAEPAQAPTQKRGSHGGSAHVRRAQNKDSTLFRFLIFSLRRTSFSRIDTTISRYPQIALPVRSGGATSSCTALVIGADCLHDMPSNLRPSTTPRILLTAKISPSVCTIFHGLPFLLSVWFTYTRLGRHAASRRALRNFQASTLSRANQEHHDK